MLGGTGATAATHSPAAAGRLGTPAGDERGSRLSGHIAAGMGVLPVEKKTLNFAAYSFYDCQNKVLVN